MRLDYLLMNLAFLSYSHHDAAVAEWLQRKLEQFNLSRQYVNPVDEDCHFLRPIFRDRTDLSSGVLSEVIDRNLAESKFLIVLCSPHSAESVWVSKEVQYFFEHKGMHFVIPIVIDGEPYSGGARECMPIYMREYVDSHVGKEMLCLNMLLEGRHRTFLHVVALLLGVPFADFCDRYNRHVFRRMMALSLGIVSFFTVGIYLTLPVQQFVQLLDEGNQLPHEEGMLIIDGQVYSLNNYDTILKLPACPGYKRGSAYELQFIAPFYDTLHLSINRGYGWKDMNTLQLKRNDSFAYFSGVVLNDVGEPIAGANVTIGKINGETDSVGHFLLQIPLKYQAVTQSVLIQKEGMRNIVREDECPDQNLIYIMYTSETK